MAVDLDAYERLGDLTKPFEVTAKDRRRQDDRERLRDSLRCDVAPLTFEQYRAGLPCPGCGRPYVDSEPFDFKGTMNLSGAERMRHDAEASRFKAAHSSCSSHSHGVSGSLTRHCGKCCPMPPLSPSQVERIGVLMQPTPSHELMVWRLRLYCGHVVERTAHRSHRTVHAAFSGSVKCAECGCDPATVIDAQAVGLRAEPSKPQQTLVVRKPTRAALERRIEELETEVARLRGS
ncbi:hypothetical protein PT015_24295 [Candidatus Mycobacterium wuenschmannii]|uniref:Uncharacterized protein n=1 Tax=Candidatus Mycobacterium wuenschmannii TaxID=3027808 RepID=A0ABY8VW87_9MYCO|nr:hypothetical protein [Candidatus Mycobacterium wuenschmannii]WIM87900.1 hypothetical protein PT015_24295 [Candidatus Mycobacterium wuenschmannii]